jgi:hypothetical protein
MGKPSETRRIQFDKKERTEALRLSTLMAEAVDARTEYLKGVMRQRGIDVDATDWNYDPLTGVAVRIR